MYDDKLIFWNEGQLPENWTVERLKQKHPSKPFNPDIATTLFRAGLIEAWGRGIEKINTECKKAGVPTPEINYDFGGLMLTFKIVMPPKTREKTREKILKIISENPSISTKEMAEIIGITQKGIEWQIAQLKKDGAIERVGSAKGGYWNILS